MSTFLFLTFAAFLALIVYIWIASDRQSAQIKVIFQKLGIVPTEIIAMNKYLCGHPKINYPTQNTFIWANNGKFLVHDNCPLGAGWNGYKPSIIGEIPFLEVEDIQVEDATTIERRLTVGRLALLGIFAFALKKERKNELAYVTIKWKQGKFQHETIFEFDSIASANIARNRLINASLTHTATNPA